MQDKTLDDFDRFCRIAQNPISETNKYCNYNLSGIESSLYRSNSVRERVPKTLKVNKTDQLSSHPISCSESKIIRARSFRKTNKSDMSITNPLEIEQEKDQLLSNISSGEDNKIVRLRSFRRTTKGIVCNKDTIEIESEKELSRSFDMRNLSNNNDHFNFKNDRKPELEIQKLPNDNEIVRYTITLFGQEGVGKTSLCQQLLLPEYLVSQADEIKSHNEPQMIRVLIDNQESILQLIDSENYDNFIEPKQEVSDAYLVIYAIDDNSSFETCRKLIANLVLTNVNPPLVILVANKSDLVRSRVVSTDKGKRLAGIYNLKFKEISTSLNHCVDELLVLLVTEMRNASKKNEKHKVNFISRGFQSTPYRSSLRIKVSNNAVSRFIQKHFNKSSDNVSIND